MSSTIIMWGDIVLIVGVLCAVSTLAGLCLSVFLRPPPTVEGTPYEHEPFQYYVHLVSSAPYAAFWKALRSYDANITLSDAKKFRGGECIAYKVAAKDVSRLCGMLMEHAPNTEICITSNKFTREYDLSQWHDGAT